MENIFKNILLLLPSMALAFKLHNLFETNDRLRNLGVITKCSVSSAYLNTSFLDEFGDKFLFTEEEKKSRELMVDAWMKYHNDGGSRTMLITSMSHSTAETLSHLSTVIMMRDITSHELFMQIMGRPNNTGNEDVRYTGLVVPKGIFLSKIAKAYLVHTELYPDVSNSLANIIMKWYDCADSMFYLNGDKWNTFQEEDVLEQISIESIKLKNDLEKNIDILDDIDNDSNDGLKSLFVELGKENPDITISSSMSMNENLGSNGEQARSNNNVKKSESSKYLYLLMKLENFVNSRIIKTYLIFHKVGIGQKSISQKIM